MGLFFFFCFFFFVFFFFFFFVFFSDFLYERLCCGYPFELDREVDTIQKDTNNICLYKEVDRNYTGCNLKTTKLLDCALIRVCAVIRSNMAYKFICLNHSRSHNAK